MEALKLLKKEDPSPTVLQLALSATYSEWFSTETLLPVAVYEHHDFPCKLTACWDQLGNLPTAGCKTKCFPQRDVSHMDSMFGMILQNKVKECHQELARVMNRIMAKSLKEWTEVLGDGEVDKKVINEHMQKFGLAFCVITDVQRGPKKALEEEDSQEEIKEFEGDEIKDHLPRDEILRGLQCGQPTFTLNKGFVPRHELHS